MGVSAFSVEGTRSKDSGIERIVVGREVPEQRVVPENLKLPDSYSEYHGAFKVSSAEVLYIRDPTLVGLLSESVATMKRQTESDPPVQVEEHKALLVLRAQRSNIYYTLRDIDIPIANVFADAINEEVSRNRLVDDTVIDGVKSGSLAVIYAGVMPTSNGVLIGRFQNYGRFLKLFDTESYLDRGPDIEPVQARKPESGSEEKPQDVKAIMDFEKAKAGAEEQINMILRS